MRYLFACLLWLPLVCFAEVFEIPDVQAQFVGGETAIQNFFNTSRKFDLANHPLDGTVWIEAILTEAGVVSSAVVKKGLSRAYDAEAMRMVKAMPNWVPAQRGEKPIRSQVSIPVVFTRVPQSPKRGADEEVFTIVDEMPSYLGGNKKLFQYLAEQTIYPVDAVQAGVSGTVHTSFVVTETGDIEDVRVLYEVYPSLDAEAIRVVRNMQNWMPGKKNGKPVRVSYNLPIKFTLNTTEEIFSDVDVAPEYATGEDAMFEYLGRNTRYPPNAVDQGISGTVEVKFVITKEGLIANARVVKSVNPELDAEAVRVIESMGKWTPGKHNGEAVNSYYTVPITFVLKYGR